MNMSIRPANPETDIEGIAVVVNAFESESVTTEMVKQWFERMPPGRVAHRMVAANEAGGVIGYGVAVHETWSPEGQFYVWVGIDGAWRGRGLGFALYEDARLFLREQGAGRLKSEVRDDDPASLRFAERNGFAIDRHQFESALDLTTFDETPDAGVIPRLEAEGITFASMADFQDSPEARRRLYEVNCDTSMDLPGVDGAYPSFDEFEQLVCGGPWYRPAGEIVALDGEQWVGLSAVQLLPEKQGAYNVMTGVIRPYRGRKIALALKLLAIRYARAAGALYLGTDNDSLNAPMLAVNRRLGYQPRPGKYLLVKAA
jgi:GNAT superfamily N-acetyltransferase